MAYIAKRKASTTAVKTMVKRPRYTMYKKPTALSSFLSIAESKFIINYTSGSLNHNAGCTLVNPNGSPVLFGNLLRTNTGSLQIQRIGDTVYAERVTISIVCNLTVDQMKLRFLILATPPDQSNVSNPNDLWRTNSGIGLNKLLDSVNTDKYTVVRDSIEDLHRVVGGGTVQNTQRFVYSIPLGRKLNYQTDVSGAGGIPKLQRDCLSFAAIPFHDIAATSGTSIGSYEMKVEFVYKDF